MIFRRMFAFPEDVIDLLNDGKCDVYFSQLVQLKFRLYLMHFDSNDVRDTF